jgi:hypothetical protein
VSARADTEPAVPVPAEAGTGESAGLVADPAGRLLSQLTVVPTLLATAWLLTGLPLLLLGVFRPVVMLVISVPLAAVLTVLGLRWTSGRLPAHGAGPSPEGSRRTPWWSVAALIAVAVAFGIDQAVYHSQQIIVQRDPASYMQFGYWIARHGSLPIPQDAAAFGGTHHALTFASPAFYQVGHTIVPQFMAGLPMTLAGGYWAGGVSLAAAMGALLAACGVLTLGGLAARLIGPRWAPLAALVLALTLPEQFTARSTYSEPLTQVLFLGGLCLLIDSFSLAGAGRKWLAALGGLAVGLTLLVRIDGASDMLPLIPYCGLLLVRRRAQALPLIGGLVLGLGYGLIDGLVLSQPYLHTIKSSLLPLVAIAAILIGATGTVVLALWHQKQPVARPAWLPNAAAVLAVAVAVGLAIRPYLQTVRATPTATDRAAMIGYQRADHLPIQPDRLYYEISLHWIFWYVGIPAVVLATVGAALLARRCVQGRSPAWTLPLLSFAWIIVATLVRPAIIPDQPWASRRLVPGVLPGFILLAIWATAWLAAWLRQRGTGPVLRGAAVAIIAAALVIPAAWTSFGLRIGTGGVTVAGLADKVTWQGEAAAISRMCAAIPADASVVIIETKVSSEMSEVVRGMCGVPTATMPRAHPLEVRRVVAGIRRAGRQPVLLALSASQLVRYGGPVTQVMALHVLGDPHTLVTPPLAPVRSEFVVWMSKP